MSPSTPPPRSRPQPPCGGEPYPRRALSARSPGAPKGERPQRGPDMGCDGEADAASAPRLDAPHACAIARAAIDALADLDAASVRTLIAATPRGLQRRRQIAMYLAHTALGTRASDVAKQFGRDTTTAYHAFRQIEDLRDDPRIDGFLEGIDAVLVSLAEATREPGTDAAGSDDRTGNGR